jgi:hypothetical protein
MKTILIVGLHLLGILAPTTAHAARRNKLIETSEPAVNASEIPPLASLLDRAGWIPTPELSGVYRVGSIFHPNGSAHTLMVRQCFEAPVAGDTYTAMEVVTQLQAGVRMGAGVVRARAEGELVKKVRFGTPIHHTIERLAMTPSKACREMLSRTDKAQQATMYAVQEVLTAEIAEQTCGKLNASGSFVGLGKAEAEFAQACAQESLDPVAVAYRVVPVSELINGWTMHDMPTTHTRATTTHPACPWGEIRSVSSTMTTLTVNGQTYDVRKHADLSKVMDIMQSCGRFEAARAFQSWRGARQFTNISFASIALYSAGIGSAIHANNRRKLTEKLLLHPDRVPSETRAKFR